MRNLQLHNEKYKNFLANKRVAIIGPSESAFFSENGNYIDSFDIVVRINRGIELVQGRESFIGSKTTILYNSLDFDLISGGILSGINDDIKFICCPYSIEAGTYKKYHIDSMFDKFNIRFINTEIYNKLTSDTRSRVNSGLGAIVDLLQHDIQQLFITGIDYYRSFYHEDYCSERNRSATTNAIEEELEFKRFDDINHHNPDRQYAYFKELSTTDSRIILDSFMAKIIKDKRYDNWDTIPRN